MREQLIHLREKMAAAGVDIYIIPTDDFHGSEYCGAYFGCRAFISGFDGSAGTLAVTADWAGLWTDGRYFLQAADQLSGTGIDLMKMAEPGVPTLQDWVKDTLTGDMVLGFDGRTMTSGAGEELEKIALQKGASVSHALDLVGEIWENRPPMSQAPVWELEEQYAGRSRADKLSALRADVQKQGADVHILTSLDDICWLLNIRGDDVACCPVVLSFLLLDETGCWLYTDQGKFSPELKARLEADGIGFRPYLDIYEDVKAIAPGTAVLIDSAKLSFSILKNMDPAVKLIVGRNPTELPKAIKTKTECDNERIAHIKDGAALTRFMKWLKEAVGKETVTEISAAEKLETFRQAQEHYFGPSFDPIIGYGPHGAIIHYSATPETDVPMKPEGLVLCDTGGHYLEGSTDVTRTFVLGPLTEEMKYYYTIVLKSHLELGAAVFKKGCTGLNLDYIARKPFWDLGLDYNHGTGHGVGYLLSVHEGPQNIRYGSRGGAAALEVGMISSNEPGFYLEGKFGIRLENLVLTEERMVNQYGTFYGFETLTMCPYELEAILPEMLSPEERKLLNDYHAKVYETLSPLFDEEERQWLESATRAI